MLMSCSTSGDESAPSSHMKDSPELFSLLVVEAIKDGSRQPYMVSPFLLGRMVWGAKDRGFVRATVSVDREGRGVVY
jgi:hypothetical protein